jgi:hypothetical protein
MTDKRQGYVQLGDNWYAMVATRVGQFREEPEYAGWTINTIVTHGKQSILVRCEILDPDGRLRSSGHSEKPWRDGKASAKEGVERTETAAVGRALANMGLLASEGIASYEEVSDALLEERDALRKQNSKLVAHTTCLRDRIDSAAEIKQALFLQKWDVAVQAYEELTDDEKIALFAISTRDGGIWTTDERKLIKEGDGIREARRAYYAEQETEHE